MRLALSNLALPAFNHLHMLRDLRAFGVEGIEIAPDHSWPRPFFGQTFKAQEVATFGQTARLAGLHVVGLHAVLGGRPEFAIFDDADIRHHTVEHLFHLSEICRDLGGKTIIIDSRWARGLNDKDAFLQCRALLERLLPRIESHGTILCFSPLAPDEGDFCRLASECLMLVNALDHSSFGLHLATAALAQNGETGHMHFAARRGRLDHVHIDEPGKAPLCSTGLVDHADMRRHLSAISYSGWATVVQRFNPKFPANQAVFSAVRNFEKIYRPATTSRSAQNV